MTDASAHRDARQSRISVVLPVYNESGILDTLTDRIRTVLDSRQLKFEIVFVNDGSTDGSREKLDSIAAADPRIGVLHLSRNFGHQPAVHAGLQQCRGDVVVVMDSDLQDNPDAIPDFLHAWQDGNDVVYAERFNRKEVWWKRLLFHGFYRVLNAVSEIPIPQDAGNFGLMDRRVVDTLLSLPESDRYFPGLRSWVGFRQQGIPVERDARYDDHARVSIAGLFRLAKTAIFSFSTFPLTLFCVIAVVSAAVCAGTTGFVLYHKLVTGLAIPGWASSMVTASFFGALNALGISVLGEYVIRIYREVRRRPIHLLDSVHHTDLTQSGEPPVRSDSHDEQRLLEIVQQIDHMLSTQSTSSVTQSR